MRVRATLAVLLALATPAFAEPRVSPAPSPSVAQAQAQTPVAAEVVGRAVRRGAGWLHQWPGVYFEAAFQGTTVWFDIGGGDQIVRVLVDGAPLARLNKPLGRYRVEGLEAGPHVARVEIVTESQAAPNLFGGFFLDGQGALMAPKRLDRQIEFIGDSHTVGFGNTSPTRECTREDVWARTDTSQAFGPIVANRFRADYQINAISGRGIVRNYAGRPGRTLPQAYPYALLETQDVYEGAGWRPDLIVVALGTNDFSTPLAASEPWATREALHADFVEAYTSFVQTLRRRNPDAYLVLWATDIADGEVQAQVQKVVARLRAEGEGRLSYLAIDKLAMTGCAWHPSVDDDRRVATAIIEAVEAQGDVFASPTRPLVSP
jgi:lysophospholipase L1-like esterase